MKVPEALQFESFFTFRLILLRLYFNETEGNLNHAIGQSRKIRKNLFGHDAPEEVLKDPFREDWFPQYSRYTIILFLMATIEWGLRGYCVELGKRISLPENQTYPAVRKGLEGPEIDRCKAFIKAHLPYIASVEEGENVVTAEERWQGILKIWYPFDFLSAVRNCIAHGWGEVEMLTKRSDKNLIRNPSSVAGLRRKERHTSIWCGILFRGPATMLCDRKRPKIRPSQITQGVNIPSPFLAKSVRFATLKTLPPQCRALRFKSATTR